MSDMYIYDNDQEMQENETFQENGYEMPQTPKPNRKKTNAGMKRIAKRAGAIALSAVLFGGVAAGTFQGVNRLTGYSAKLSQDTAKLLDTEQTLLKTTSSGTANKGTMDVSAIAKAAMPSIVAITNKSVQEVESFFGMFGRNAQIQQEEVESCGSGIIIGKNDTELLVVTNNHVVEGADTLSVCFINDEACEAVIKGRDAAKDLAVVAVPLESISTDTMSKISVASIGDSEKLEVGEQVVAIGNALGYGQAVTTGIVSATNRTLDSEQTEGASYDGISLIQTDAAINPGNSGGALLNMDGKVIGINSAKLASTEVEGMGYALSINDAYETIQSLMNLKTRTEKAAVPASLGIKGTDVSTEAQEAYGIPSGVFIAEVTSGGAAEAAGIVQNSVITSFDGQPVSEIMELKELLEYYEAGETVEVKVQVPGQNGYEEKAVSVTLGKAETSTAETEETLEDFKGRFFDYPGNENDPV